MAKEKEGFIVHPFETDNNKYHASYGNHNKTIKSFDTLRDAKKYLKNKGYNQAKYDAPSGVKTVSTKTTMHKKTTHRKSMGLFGMRL